ncbi:Vacuolar fusion protein CCZ1 -like protein [Escovopsis weberi]|uniref:Vacuolar fusion protein CCZ1-like protein n=1 Tax=Escovopsis weberi TaxID=150374 RepID=A0A0M8N7K1_ESCWE|nr:Vacuolar fusion protein CCZ1 -like protein [Escovopsis weberi]
MAAAPASGIVPAQLGFFAIFNPSLGTTDETLDDQIVYYASIGTQSSRRKRRPKARPTDDVSLEERHERLRQIGLAQGMVNFSRGFSDGAPVDAIDTQKSRVVAHELEPGWWILASVDLNKVPLPPRLPTKPGERPEERFEYTSREMKPAQLLLQDLLRAHGIFLLHHDSSLGSLYHRCHRARFVAILSRYWDLFLSTWSVMLHGNPIRDVFGGISVAASGELGVGVGEEERGSGEREVLEGLIGRIEGLVDLVVSRFGEESDAPSSLAAAALGSSSQKGSSREAEPWLGSGKEPSVEDGVIFTGTGALSRRSLRDVAHWMEDLYTWGEHAYGVIDCPTSTRRGRAAKTSSASRSIGKQKAKDKDDLPASGAPSTEGARPDEAPAKPAADETGQTTGHERQRSLVSYLTLGYGSYWSLPGALTGGQAPKKPGESGTEAARGSGLFEKPPSIDESAGHYLIGLRGEIEEEPPGNRESNPGSPSADPDAENNSRTDLRTVHVELEPGIGSNSNDDSGNGNGNGNGNGTNQADAKEGSEEPSQWQFPGIHPQAGSPGSPGSPSARQTEKLRVVVYVNRPFVFTFLFRLRTDSLARDGLYRSLHYQLAPLRRPLLASTKFRPERPDTGPSSAGIRDIVWDPASLTVHSTIPNIPDPYGPDGGGGNDGGGSAGAGAGAAGAAGWSRADAVSTHINLLNIHFGTRARPQDLERTQKTSRGWWIVWTRVRHAEHPRKDSNVSAGSNIVSGSYNHNHSNNNLAVIREHDSARSSASSVASQRSRRTASRSPGPRGARAPCAQGKEIYLIRRASDHVGYLVGDEGSGAGGDGRLAQGIGVDTRRYVEELLSLF